MTVESQVCRVSYDTDGVNTVFPVPFWFIEPAHLKVILVEPDGDAVLQLKDLNYSVLGTGDPNGGAVILKAIPAGGGRLVIIRNPPATQLADYEQNARFPAASHERALDKGTMVDQRTRDLADRSLHLDDHAIDGWGTFNARGNRIVDLENGKDGRDAVNLGQLLEIAAKFGVPAIAPPNTVFLTSFGAKGNAPGKVDLSIPLEMQRFIPGDDDSQALTYALAYAAAHPGTTVVVPPGHYMLDSMTGWDIPGHTTIVGLGEAIFDTRRREYFNANTNALFRITGGGRRLGEIRLLTGSAKTWLNRPLNPVSAVHSGGIITMTFSFNHGLSVDDLIYVRGEPGDSGYGGFYHVERRSTGLTLPGPVLSVPNSTTITYAATAPIAPEFDTLSGSLLRDVRVMGGSDMIRLADTTGIKVGDDFIVGSQAIHRSGGEKNHIGEWAKVAFVVDGTRVRLNQPLRENYLLSDQAKIIPVDTTDNVHISGLTFIGKGANVLPGVLERGDRGVSFSSVTRSSFKNNRVLHFDLIAVGIDHARGFECSFNTVIQDSKDQGGRISGFIDLSYPIAYSMCSEDLVFYKNRIEGGRHSISQNGDSSPTNWGICRNILIDSNTCRRSFIDCISTHQGVENLIITRNDINSVGGGINPRFCRNVIISENIVYSGGPSIFIHNHFRDIQIINNTLSSACGACFGMGSLQNLYDPPIDVGRHCVIRGNLCLRGYNFIAIGSESCPALLDTTFVIENNVVENISGNLVQIQCGALITVRSATGNGILTRFSPVVSYWLRSDITITIDGVLTTAYTWDDDTGQVVFNTAPANGAVIVFTSSTVHGWQGVVRNNIFRVGKGEATASAFDLRNPCGVEIYGNVFMKSDGGIVKYQRGLLVRGPFTTGVTIGENPGLREVCGSTPIEVASGTTGSIRPDGLLPRISDSNTTSPLTWTSSDGLSNTLTLSGSLSVNRPLTLSADGRLAGDKRTVIRTGAGSSDWSVVDGPTSTNLVNTLATGETAEFMFQDNGSWRLMNRYSATA